MTPTEQAEERVRLKDLTMRVLLADPFAGAAMKRQISAFSSDDMSSYMSSRRNHILLWLEFLHLLLDARMSGLVTPEEVDFLLTSEYAHGIKTRSLASVETFGLIAFDEADDTNLSPATTYWASQDNQEGLPILVGHGKVLHLLLPSSDGNGSLCGSDAFVDAARKWPYAFVRGYWKGAYVEIVLGGPPGNPMLSRLSLERCHCLPPRGRVPKSWRLAIHRRNGSTVVLRCC